MRHIDFLSGRPAGADALYRPFVKMHGLQNHFVIVDQRSGGRTFDKADVVRICDPHVGVGGEQLLTIEHPTEGGRRDGAYAAMRIFNVDGREVGACGNATRCMAYLLLEEAGGGEVRIETAAGVLHCRKAGHRSISVVLGPISADWRALPAARAVDTLHLPVESGPLRDGAASISAIRMPSSSSIGSIPSSWCATRRRSRTTRFSRKASMSGPRRSSTAARFGSRCGNAQAC